MPIEIRELVIRATIDADGSPSSRSPRTPGGRRADDETAPLDVEAIVQECVRQVLRVLAREKER
jgi:hypothetical protein